jgi:hypothetical protein
MALVIGFIWIFVLGPFTGLGILVPLLLDPTGIAAAIWCWIWLLLHMLWFDGSKYQKAL